MTCAPYNFGRRETGCETGMLIYELALKTSGLEIKKKDLKNRAVS